ncbi:hypothetical protein L0B52_06425 [Suttonella sp. R2A3]|uniref:hypothetical protein n=1 Tax=Suttonella sp. R2A3 TaxID=2908648 RepID=UPI001F1FD993|nr:hypothetical protein [Suttonella sp. R2A3]UJF23974.1 hypothetical protein L0B52_06425 [Suttonella sp. R2A3]
MQQHLKRLLRVQAWIWLLTLLVAALIAQFHLLAGIAAGGLLGISATLVAMMIFRRMPEVVSAKTFFSAMVVYELAKWLVIATLGIVLMQQTAFAPLGLIIGFFMVQMAYFWLIMPGKHN